ncbi:DUF5925 domain-containing protein [Streptacidiphilus rugosus]|uniref:DUF5925 domain-containing protein n=1 Tax=Streptacidiphilus rugosus TaxID=405783 RepID=UPI0018DE03C9|nr:DUF5925 domain-containing protein [Streptacidiphilus rugosus]
MTDVTDCMPGLDQTRTDPGLDILSMCAPPIERGHPRSVLDAAFLVAYINGSQPYAEKLRGSSAAVEEALPPGGRLLRCHKSEAESVYLVGGPGWTMKLVYAKSAVFSSSCDVMITAVDKDLAHRVLKDAGLLDETQAGSETDVPMGFWHLSSHGSARVSYRDIHAPSWDDIHDNYAGTVDRSFGELTRLTPATMAGKGRLVLMYGPPGTGKTTAMRSLARAWKDWCHVDCVLDPDALFNNTGYLMDLTLYNHGGPTGGSPDKWRLLLIEDCDSLVRDDSRRAAGQSLARLLSLTDGLIGQGRNIIVAITTNEELSRLHPAVTRPGRCLSRIEVGKLSAAEATNWLADTGVTADLTGGASLAELFALRSGHLPSLEPAPSFGMYM